MILSLNNYHPYCENTAGTLVCTDSGTSSRYTAYNRKHHQVRQYLVDGDVIRDRNVNKCDWIVTEEELKHAY